MSKKIIQEAANDFVKFINRGPSPYHVVEECKTRLVSNGFKELKEKEAWKVLPMGKYFIINNFSTIIAFAVGGKYKPGNGFSIIGAHTDSPCLKVKPRSCVNKQGYVGVGVQCYGGGIWHTWFDRDLKLAGRAIVKEGTNLVHRLVHIDEPILKVPNICIHLARDYHASFSPNKETHIVPVLATTVQEKLEEIPHGAAKGTTSSCHPPVLQWLLSNHLKCKPDDILDFELCLADTQPAAIGGALKEFVFAPRIDNLMNCYTGLQGLIESMNSLPDDRNVRMLCMFDNEEVGSMSAQGAQSAMFEWTLRRISASDECSVTFEEAIPKSYVVSADQAHAVHPNYPEKHESNHTPMLHEGVVVKYNANQRYATTAITASIFREIASKCGVPLQDVAVRNDSSCGSTIGPIISTGLGIRTLDTGTPQLSMHSIREMCCTTGVHHATTLYKEFYKSFPDVDDSLTAA